MSGPAGEATKLQRLRAVIEQGRRSGISDRTANQILAEARAHSTPTRTMPMNGIVAPRRARTYLLPKAERVRLWLKSPSI